MEGYEIPYKSFGYHSLLDFVRDSGQFDWYTTNDGIQIQARASKNSQHIVDLVGSQNRVRRKKTTKSMPFRPQFNSRPVSELRSEKYIPRLTGRFHDANMIEPLHLRLCCFGFEYEFELNVCFCFIS